MLSMQFPNPQPLNMNKPLSLFTHCNDFAVYYKPNSSLLKSRLAVKSSKCNASRNDVEKNQILMPGGLDQELMPKHVAVIMDGNRRWARNRGLPVQLGHRAGGKAMKQLARNCMKYGVKVVSVFAFSTENWVRPQEEVDFLMNLFEEDIMSEVEELMRDDIRITFLGNRRCLPMSLQEKISGIEENAKTNKGTHLVVAMNYSGRYDITEATKKIAAKIQDGVFQVEEIDDALFEQHLETNVVEFSNPDLMIRTGGELRVSNFMLWQLAYTEMFFPNKMFPDFDEVDLVDALNAYQQRQRRFGGHKY